MVLRKPSLLKMMLFPLGSLVVELTSTEFSLTFKSWCMCVHVCMYARACMLASYMCVVFVSDLLLNIGSLESKLHQFSAAFY